MDAHQGFFLRRNVAFDQREMLVIVDVGVVDDGAKVAADAGRQRRRGGAINQRIVVQAVLNQVGVGDHFELMLLGEAQQIRLARHGAIVFHDFADDPGRFESGQARQIHRPFGLAGAH